jgi:hypothetical protein
MNEEYLWSKKGSDPEIERLEGLLAEFRFGPDDSLNFLPAQVPESRGFFANRFAWILGIATPSFALALFVLWILNPNASGDIQARDPRAIDTATEMQSRSGTHIPARISTELKKSKSLTTRHKNDPKTFKTVYISRKSKAERSGTLTASRLTNEEKYAYNRLMLALSIAGTKLKVVQDTVDGKESIRNEK